MQKTIYVDEIQSNVIIARRKGTRSIRLALRGDGTIRLSAPYSISEQEALKFLHSKKEWILQHNKPSVLLHSGNHIGKSWRLYFEQTNESKPKSRLLKNVISIKVPTGMHVTDDSVQSVAKKACERALAKEAERLLPQRLEVLASKHDIAYRSCKTKKLKSRWGSCDNRKNIVLNIYLTQLPWELIDYVILHELAHTKHQHHQSDFWDYVEELLPNYKELRKTLRSNPTTILPTTY